MIRLLEEEKDLTSTIFSILGTIISVGLNLTPCVLFYEFFKGKREIKSIPEMMFVTGVFCCTTNLTYGLLKQDIMLNISNSICLILQILYSTLFLFFYANKNFSKWILYVFIAWNLTLEILYIFVDVIPYHTSKNFGTEFNGKFNIVIGLINVITPGQNIFKVFKSEDFTLIPIVTIIFQCLCSSFWGIYGFKDMDSNIIIPNVLGVVLALTQIIIYYYFYCKRKGVPPKKEETNNENEEQNDEREEKEDGENKDENNLNLISK